MKTRKNTFFLLQKTLNKIMQREFWGGDFLFRFSFKMVVWCLHNICNDVYLFKNCLNRYSFARCHNKKIWICCLNSWRIEVFSETIDYLWFSSFCVLTNDAVGVGVCRELKGEVSGSRDVEISWEQTKNDWKNKKTLKWKNWKKSSSKMIEKSGWQVFQRPYLNSLKVRFVFGL
jgi:hypothetical protein